MVITFCYDPIVDRGCRFFCVSNHIFFVFTIVVDHDF